MDFPTRQTQYKAYSLVSGSFSDGRDTRIIAHEMTNHNGHVNEKYVKELRRQDDNNNHHHASDTMHIRREMGKLQNSTGSPDDVFITKRTWGNDANNLKQHGDIRTQSRDRIVKKASRFMQNVRNSKPAIQPNQKLSDDHQISRYNDQMQRSFSEKLLTPWNSRSRSLFDDPFFIF